MTLYQIVVRALGSYTTELLQLADKILPLSSIIHNGSETVDGVVRWIIH